MHLHWLSRHANKNGEEPHQQINNMCGNAPISIVYPILDRNPEGKLVLATRFSRMKTKIPWWNGVYRGTVKKHISFSKFLNCVVKLSLHLQLIKSMLLDSLTLTTTPQTRTIINSIVIPPIAATMDRVHMYGTTRQIAYIWTRMARNALVQHRFCVFNLSNFCCEVVDYHQQSINRTFYKNNSKTDAL